MSIELRSPSTDLTTPLISEQEDLCPICHEPLDERDADLEQGQTAEKVIRIGTAIEIRGQNMIAETPCHHFYHPTCIGQWINVKLGNNQTPSCPECRGNLNGTEISSMTDPTNITRLNLPQPELAPAPGNRRSLKICLVAFGVFVALMVGSAVVANLAAEGIIDVPSFFEHVHA